MLYRLMNGNSSLLGKAFTTEARHRFTAELPWMAQRQVLWEAVTPYDSQPSPDEIVDLEEVEIVLGIKKVTFN